MLVAQKLWVALLACAMACPIAAQTLARRGWAGSGLSVESWWQSAVLYQIDSATFQGVKNKGSSGLGSLTERLDYLQSLSIDALVLSHCTLESTKIGATASPFQPFDPACGTEEDRSSLLQEASRRNIRILVDLPFNNTLSGEETINSARFWLSRGIAGLRLVDSDAYRAPTMPALTAAQITGRLTDLEHLCSSYPGQRILFWDQLTPFVNPSSTSVSARRPTHSRSARSQLMPSPSNSNGPQLVLDSRLLELSHWEAAGLRSLLLTHASTFRPLAVPVFESDADNHPRSLDRLSAGAHSVEIAKQVAALLLLSPAVPQLYFGQELGFSQQPGMPGAGSAFTGNNSQVSPGADAFTAHVALKDPDGSSLLNWYRRLSTLRHGNAALRGGSLDLLPVAEPDTVAWMRRAGYGSDATFSPVVIVCNLSARTVVVSLSAGLRALGVPTGTNLRTVASSSNSASDAPASLGALTLTAYSVYVGELRALPGLESVPASRRQGSGHSSAR